MRRKFLILSAAVVASSVAALLFWRSGNRPARQGLPDAVTGAISAQDRVQVLPEWRLAEGTVLVYDLVDRGSLGSELVAITGQLKLEVVAASAKGYLAWLSIALESVSPAGPGGPLQELLPQLGRGTLVTLGRRGFVLELATVQDGLAAGLAIAASEASGIAFWRSLFGRLHADWDRSETAATFRRVEPLDATKVDVAYSYSGSCVAKVGVVLALRKAWTPAQGAPTQSKGSSVAHFREGCQGPAALRWNGDEVLANGSVHLAAHTELDLAWRREDHVEVEAIRKRISDLLAQVPAPAEASNQGIDAAVIGTLDEGQLIGLLRQQDGREELSQDLYLQLKSWLTLHPESMPNLRRATQDLTSEDQRLRGFIKALSAIGSVEAQAVLLGMINDATARPELQQRIITSLGFVSRPSEATVQAMLALAELGADPATTQRALMAAGVLGSRLRTSSDAMDQQRALVLEQQLAAELKGSSSERETYDLLAALGNLGPTNTAAVRERIMRGGSPEVRGHAFFALRFSPEPGVAGYLVKAYSVERGDGAAQVRAEIVRALAAGHPDLAWFNAIAELSDMALSEGEVQALGRALSSAASIDAARSKAGLDKLLESSRNDQTRQLLLSLRDTPA